MFTKGRKIQITKAAHAYSHMGITDHNLTIDEMVEVMTVKSARQTQNGLKVHFRRYDNTGYAINVNCSPLFSFEAL
jgi:hypothetical protein